MDVETKTLIEEQHRLFGQFRESVDRELTELKTKGIVTPETKASIDAMNARFDEIEVKLRRPRIDTTSEPEQKSAGWRATEKYLRHGLKGNVAVDQMDADEKKAFGDMRTKALAASTDAGGGVLVPEDFQASVVKKLANLAGVSAMVSHQTTSRDTLRWPRIPYSTDDVDTSALAITWEDEPDTATPTDQGSLSTISIPIKKARGLILVGRELVEDAVVDIMGLLSGLISDKVNVEGDRVFSVGAGGKRPEGFMTNTDIGTVNSGTSGAFTMDGILNLVHTLPGQYAEGASFMTKRLSMGLIRKLKDGTGRYLWEPSQQAGQPATLCGYPIRGNEHIASAAAASRSLIFADFKRLYMVADRVGLSIQRLDEKYADTDQIGFIFRYRVGGAVIAPWAAKIQVLS